MQELEQLKQISLFDVDDSELVDIKKVKINTKLAPTQRLESFIYQVKNPYLYKHGKTVVKISFSHTEDSLEDKLLSYFSTL